MHTHVARFLVRKTLIPLWVVCLVLAFGLKTGAATAARVNGEAVDREDAVLLAREVLSFKADPLPDRQYRQALQKVITNRLLHRRAQKEAPEIVAAAERLVDLLLAREYEGPYFREFVLPRAREEVTLDTILPDVGPQEDTVYLFQIVFEDAQTAGRVRECIVNGEIGFQEAARRYSKGLTASAGGEVGYVRRSSSRYSPRVMDRVFSFPVGEITPVVETALGPSLFWIKEKRSAADLRLEAARNLRADRVQARAREILWQDAEAYADAHGIRLLLSGNGGGDDGTPDPEQVVIETPDKGYTMADLLLRSGGAQHGPKDMLTIAENAYRDLAIAAKYTALRGALPGHARKRRVLVEHYTARKLVDRLTKSVTVESAEIDSYLAEHKEEFVFPESLEIGIIFVRSEPRLKQVEERLAEGKAFEEVARAWSQHGSAKFGGKAGLVPVKQLTAPFRGLDRLKPGEVSDPIRVVDGGKAGYYLVKVYRRVPEHYVTREELNEQGLGVIRSKILARKREAVLAAYLAQVYRGAEVEIL